MIYLFVGLLSAAILYILETRSIIKQLKKDNAKLSNQVFDLSISSQKIIEDSHNTSIAAIKDTSETILTALYGGYTKTYTSPEEDIPTEDNEELVSNIASVQADVVNFLS